MNIVIILISIAVIFYLLRYVYLKNELFKQPKGFIFILFCLGFIGAFITAFFGYDISNLLKKTIGESLNIYLGINSYLFIEDFLLVGFLEEGVKFLILKLNTWNSKYFKCSYDAIIYSSAIALAFEFMELITKGIENGFGISLMRLLTILSGHFVMSIVMGKYYAKAKSYQLKGNYKQVKINLLFSILAPALLHGLYDFVLSLWDSTSNQYLLIVYFAIFFYYALYLMGLAFDNLDKAAQNNKYLT